MDIDTKNGDFVSHEAVCVLNLSGETANINITIYFEDREPLIAIRIVMYAHIVKRLQQDQI